MISKLLRGKIKSSKTVVKILELVRYKSKSAHALDKKIFNIIKSEKQTNFVA